MSLIEQVIAGAAPSLVPLTVEQFHRMVETGILREGEPIELVEGLLVRKNRAQAGREGEMPHGARHATVITRLARIERRLEPASYHLRAQLPVTLSAVDEPEPDIAIIAGSLEAFSRRHPGPQDVRVVIEVADSSLSYDRITKSRVYASAGIAVYLIVNLPENQVELYEDPLPSQARYRRRIDLRAGETLTLPLGEATLSLDVSEMLGPSE
jgi:Uma2 family endonuclease